MDAYVCTHILVRPCLRERGRLSRSIFGSAGQGSSEEATTSSSEEESMRLVKAVLPALELSSTSAEVVAQGIETILPAMDSVIRKAERVLALEPDLRRSAAGGAALEGGTSLEGGRAADAATASSKVTVDVCFLVDCTRSMDEVLTAVGDKVVEMALEISQKLTQASKTGVQVRMAFVGFRDYGKQPLAPGLKWQDVGYERPTTGHVITSHALSAAMQYKQNFTEADLRAMRLGPDSLSYESHVRVLNKYYKPVKFDYSESGMSVCDFTGDADEIRRCVADQSADQNWQDIPEDLCGGLKQVLQLTWNKSSRKAVFVFSDATCHGVQVSINMRQCDPNAGRLSPLTRLSLCSLPSTYHSRYRTSLLLCSTTT